jgi:hypothetical protein
MYDLDSIIKGMNKQHVKNIEDIKMYCDMQDDVGKLCRHLLETQRNPYSIINDIGYVLESAESMLWVFRNLHHSIIDDGDITFFYVNGEPRFSFLYRHEHDVSAFLSDTENSILSASYTPKGLEYDVVFVNHWEEGVIDKWINHSKEL